jgi:hypothetical protein
MSLRRNRSDGGISDFERGLDGGHGLDEARGLGDYSFTAAAKGRPDDSNCLFRETQVRIGLFFDGTGNNMYIDEDTGEDSNVVRLYRIYRANLDLPFLQSFFWADEYDKRDLIDMHERPVAGGRERIFKIYVPGIGTPLPDGAPDIDMRARMLAKLSGPKGIERIAARYASPATGADYREKIGYALGYLNMILALCRNDATFSLDVFGFSRGGALARDFTNIVYRVAEREKLQIGVNFLGLFDTVAMFSRHVIGAGVNATDLRPAEASAPSLMTMAVDRYQGTINHNTETWNRMAAREDAFVQGFADKVKINMPQDDGRGSGNGAGVVNTNVGMRPRAVVQIEAAGELRINFPLSLIATESASADGAGGRRAVTGLGAHSDIGGGYPSVAEMDKYFDETTTLGQARKLYPERYNYVYEPVGHGIGDHAAVRVRHTVLPFLSNVYLMLMAKAARLYDVPFPEVRRLEGGGDEAIPASALYFFVADLSREFGIEPERFPRYAVQDGGDEPGFGRRLIEYADLFLLPEIGPGFSPIEAVSAELAEVIENVYMHQSWADPAKKSLTTPLEKLEAIGSTRSDGDRIRIPNVPFASSS